MTQYDITGMSCAACSARVEKVVSRLDGITFCSVNLLTNSMQVEGTADPAAIIAAIENAGFGASIHETVIKSDEDNSLLIDTQTPILLRRLGISVCFLLPLMYLGMGHGMLGLPLPFNNLIVATILQMLLALSLMFINRNFFISGGKAVLSKAPNMDTLVALGALISFLWSLYTSAGVFSESLAAEAYHNLYYESTGMILTLITVGKTLESKSKGRTTDALKALMKLVPKKARLLIEGREVEVDITSVRVGDTFIVYPGESIPVDGIVIDGNGAVDESALTGESIPADKITGDAVYGATINQNGHLTAQATRVGSDTTLAQIISMVSDAASTKAPIARIADKVSGIFVPMVIAIAFLTAVIWLLVGQDVGFALSRGISVLVISCPCALGLATPVAIMVGNGLGARNNILFKNAESLEALGKIKNIALDKTGTITEGAPKVVSVYPAVTLSEEELMLAAYLLERKSEHPLARAIITAYEKRMQSPHMTEVDMPALSDFAVLPGNGLMGRISEGWQFAGSNRQGQLLLSGNLKFIQEHISLNEEVISKMEEIASLGQTPLLFALGEQYLGTIAVADTVKEDSITAISDLKKMGIDVVMLTGDNQLTAQNISKACGVNKVYAGILPDGKADVINTLKQSGPTAMVGDGINDALALTVADCGIAIGAGTDIAMDAADVVLVKSSLRDVVSAVCLSRATIRNIKQNLFWAFFYNAVCIPLAAGVFYSAWGITLNPMIGAFAMSLSSFCVVSNALRLNLIKLHKETV